MFLLPYLVTTVGRCNATTGEEPDLIYAYQYCPTDYSWMGIVGLGVYLMFFAPGTITLLKLCLKNIRKYEKKWFILGIL